MTTRPNSYPHQPNGPPQSSNHRHYYAAPSYSRSSASLKGCCGCLYLLLSFLALLAIAALLVIVLAVKPKKPQFDLQQVTVQYISITPNDPVNAITATLSLYIRLLLVAVNPNRVGIRYGESRFTVMYRGIPLARASVPGFYQQPHGVSLVAATLAVDRVNLLQADAADLIRDAAVNDRVELRVLGNVAVRIRILNFDSPRVQVSVDCVIVISPRKQCLTYKQCGFDGLNV